MNPRAVRGLLATAGLAGAVPSRLAGDASTRTYHRMLAADGRTAVLPDEMVGLEIDGAKAHRFDADSESRIE